MPRRLQHVTRSDRRVVARSALTVIGRGVSKFAIVIFLVLAARLLSKHEFGIYSYVLVLANTFGILADPQVSLVVARDVSAGRHSPAEGFWAAVPVVTAGAVISAVGLLVFGLIDSGPGTTAPQLLVAGVFIVFNRFVGLGTDMLRAVGRFGLEATIETTSSVVLVTAASVLAARGAGITAVLGAFAATSMLTTIVCLAALRHEIGQPRRPPGHWRSLVRSGLKLSFAASTTAIATRAPLIILGSSASAAAVASYSAGLRFADAAYLLSLTAGQALLPSIAALASTDPARGARLTRRTALIALAAGGAVAMLTVPFGSTFTRLVFGGEYASAGSLMSVTMLAAPFMGMFWISWFGLVAFDGEQDVVKVTAAGALLSIAAGIALIPGTGALGAAWVYTGVLAAMALAALATFQIRTRNPRARSVQPAVR